MRSTFALPEECRNEIQDKLQAVKNHWKQSGKFYTESFSGWFSALQWILSQGNMGVNEDRTPCQWQHAWTPDGTCLVCGKKHPLMSPQKTIEAEHQENNNRTEEEPDEEGDEQ
jgi:hypothetical protein